MRDMFSCTTPFEIIHDDIDNCNAQVSYKAEFTNIKKLPTSFS